MSKYRNGGRKGDGRGGEEAYLVARSGCQTMSRSIVDS